MELDFYENDDRNYDNSEGVSFSSWLKIFGLSIGFIFGPAIVVNLLIFLIFMRMLKWKPRVTIIPLSITFGLMSIFLSKHLRTLANFSLQDIKTNFRPIIMSYLYVSVMMGIVLGFLLILYKAYELNKYPEFKHLKGWAYGFEYKPTPLDIWRKNKNKRIPSSVWCR